MFKIIPNTLPFWVYIYWSPPSIEDVLQNQVAYSANKDTFISNNHSFHQNHPGVPVDTDDSDGTSYQLTDKYTLPIAYVPPCHCDWKVLTYTHHKNNTCVTLFGGAPVLVQPFTQHLVMFMPFLDRGPHCTSTLFHYFGCHTVPIYV
jgi:hypothetical protein